MNGWERFLRSFIDLLIGGFLGVLSGVIFGSRIDITLLIGISLGLIVGILVRYCFHRGRCPTEEKWQNQDDASHAYAQQIFLATTFQIMGYLASLRAQGETEQMQTANVIMGHLGLTNEQKQQAAHQFKEGKRTNYSPDLALTRFYSACQSYTHFIRQFIEIQMSVLYANGLPSPRERAMLLRISSQLDFAQRFEEMETHIKRRFHNASAQDFTGHNLKERQHKLIKQAHLQRAYGILGLNHYATNDEVKKAYRRLISRHHPDKIAAQNTSTDIMEKATETTRVVKEAYEIVKRYRRL